jgi:hypothetical protein
MPFISKKSRAGTKRRFAAGQKCGCIRGAAGNISSIVKAVIFRPPPRKRDETIVLACFSTVDTNADAGLDHCAGLAQVLPEQMHSGLGRAILRHAVGLADRARFHGSISRSFPHAGLSMSPQIAC